MKNVVNKMKLYLFLCTLSFALISWNVGNAKQKRNAIMPGAAQPDKYIPLIANKKVGVIINQTSRIGDSSLLDFLLVRRIDVRKVFVPEHGFRGKEDAGAHIDNSVDSLTGLPVISLYGKHKKPTAQDLGDLDVLIYDLQDVGVRFYTYISTLEYSFQACAENNKQLMVLDRPNPNGFYVDGPVLDTAFRSFVGMQPIPVVYGMTPGEYVGMLKGEHWVSNTEKADLLVIACKNYEHKLKYKLPVAPSPNLRTMGAVYAYPSLCFFEGTPVSVGRGTDAPFLQYGAPAFAGKFKFSFRPKKYIGASQPMYEGKDCFGEKIGASDADVLKITEGKLQWSWLLKAYNAYPEKDKFFTPFFTKLAGTKELEEKIKKGASVDEIEALWQSDINTFLSIRKKYLLYPDF